jgi:spore maturation protein CgeB
MRIVIVGLSITSSWGNGHATTYRGLVRELATRGHSVLFLERDVDWYADNRDLPEPPYCETRLYASVDQLRREFSHDVRVADCVIVGSYVPEGIAIGEWVVSLASGVTAFYDIDTPITIAALERGQCEYISPDLVPYYDLYLSFTGGPLLGYIEAQYGSPRARPLYCSFDPEVYFPERADAQWDLGYMGTYSTDRQPPLDALGLNAARLWPDARMIVAGACYPGNLEWPVNVARVTHLPPSEHRAFYSAQRFTLNITRAEMIRAGYSPSVRLFEAAGCGTAIITDEWPGLSTFFEPGHEILVTRSAEDTVRYLREISDDERRAIGARARARALREHTAERRAGELESYLIEARTGARVR